MLPVYMVKVFCTAAFLGRLLGFRVRGFSSFRFLNCPAQTTSLVMRDATITQDDSEILARLGPSQPDGPLNIPSQNRMMVNRDSLPVLATAVRNHPASLSPLETDH